MTHDDIRNLGRIGVIMGGCSSERKISFKSGRAVLEALQQAGADAVEISVDTADDGINSSLISRYDIEVAFIALHGKYGEDGAIQQLLENMNVAYVGSGPVASQRAINKVTSQNMLRQAGIPVPEFCVVDRQMQQPEQVIQECFNGHAVVVKPATQGSSIGICIIENDEDLKPALAQAFEYDHHLLVEKFVDGRELTVGVLGDQALPIVEIRSSHRFFDFESKYQKGLTEYLVPAILDDDLTQSIQAQAIKSFQTIGCIDFARVDLLLAHDGRPYFLEINTIPGFTGTSLLPMAAQCAGYGFSELCLTLVQMAKKRHQL